MGLFEQDAVRTQMDEVAALALSLAAARVPAYDSRFSRKDFTRPQLLACLVLKAAHGLTYRAVCDLLCASQSVRDVLGLRTVPHFTTLESYANTDGILLVMSELLDELMLHVGGGCKPSVQDAAMDSTGLSITNASVYFQRVRDRRDDDTEFTKKSRASTAQHARVSRYNTPFLKVSVVVLCGLVLPAAVVATIGRSNDNCQSAELVEQLARRVNVKRLYADAGYDGEPLHVLCRERHGIESFIPPVPKTPDGSIRTRYRAMMRPLPRAYRRRSHVESFFSAMKRTAGDALRAKTPRSQIAEATLRVVAYAIRR